MVRSTATNWAKGSVLAVDAGTHLAAIIRIFEEHLQYATSTPVLEPPVNLRRTSSSQNLKPAEYPDKIVEVSGNRAGTSSELTENDTSFTISTGPFTNFVVPFTSARANAAYFMRDMISTYLITHPHLDHISGFAINTASFQHTSRPKRIAALPSTIDAVKMHIFNDVIWPNMSDEDGGVGFVSYMRLVEGGNIQFGNGESRGYIEVCDGLAVKCWSVSHGQCMRKHRHHGGGSGNTHEAFDDILSRRSSPHAMTPTSLQHGQSHGHSGDMMHPIDSSAFFLRDDHSGHEILIFGDVEPDSLSLSPRTSQVWNDAASKIVACLLKGILIECSYDNSQSDETLFGHLAPRHLIAELRVLAEKVKTLRSRGQEAYMRKRKRQSNGLSTHEDIKLPGPRGRTSSQSGLKTRRQTLSPANPASSMFENAIRENSGTDEVFGVDTPGSMVVNTQIASNAAQSSSSDPLSGLKIIIIHVKETLRDGPQPGENILSQLEKAAEEEHLGCTFAISQAGASIWL